MRRLLTRAKRAFEQHAISDVERMADHVGRFATSVAAHIAIHPHTLTPLAGDELHEAIVDPVFPDSPEIVVEEMPRVRREKVAQVLPDAVLRFVPERSGGCRVDEEQRPSRSCEQINPRLFSTRSR